MKPSGRGNSKAAVWYPMRGTHAPIREILLKSLCSSYLARY